MEPPSFVLTVSALSAPPPCPTLLIAIVAMPCAASDATAFTTLGLSLLLVAPCSQITTGHPDTGSRPAGRYSVKNTSFTDCTVGTPVRVPTGGTNSPGCT